MSHLSYFIVARDAGARLWLVIEVAVDGPAAVVSRWDTKAAADADAQRWTDLAAGAA